HHLQSHGNFQGDHHLRQRRQGGRGRRRLRRHIVERHKREHHRHGHGNRHHRQRRPGPGVHRQDRRRRRTGPTRHLPRDAVARQHDRHRDRVFGGWVSHGRQRLYGSERHGHHPGRRDHGGHRRGRTG